MPKSPPRPCTQPGCPRYAVTGARCQTHKGGRWESDKVRGNRHQRGYGRAWEKRRAAILIRDDGLCQPCQCDGRITPATEVDHITAKAHGGTDDPDNLQAICKRCHQGKTARE